MAEIKGLTLKNVTNFKGHEGEPCKQGNIYLNGKKIGYYSDSFMMGPSEIDFDSKEAEEAVKEICKAYYAEHPEEKWFEDREPDLEEFFARLITLIDFEKEFKKYLKQGFPIFATFENKIGVQYMNGFRTLEYAKSKLENKQDILKLKIYSDISEFAVK